VKRFALWAARATDALAIACFVAMFGCVLAGVVFRYGFDNPLTWSDELGRYLFIWCSLLGWVVAARRRSHLAVTMGRERLGPRSQALLQAAGALAAIAFAVVLVVYGLRISERNWDVEAASLAVTMGMVYAVVPVAALAVGLYAVADAWAAWSAYRRGGAR
jgi:TRAP-type C4-dicarboxylate transport system permease small subunit